MNVFKDIVAVALISLATNPQFIIEISKSFKISIQLRKGVVGKFTLLTYLLIYYLLTLDIYMYT